MAQMSLQEQLLKAGLSTEKRAKKAKKSSKKTRELKREVKSAAEQKRLDQLEKDKQLNKQIQQQAEQKAIQAQIIQLIAMNKQDLERGEFKYNFTDGSAVKSILVTDQIQTQLSKGILSIVRDSSDTSGYAVIPSLVADKIALRDESYLVARNERVAEDETTEDDPYADFVVPDDLMW